MMQCLNAPGKNGKIAGMKQPRMHQSGLDQRVLLEFSIGLIEDSQLAVLGPGPAFGLGPGLGDMHVGRPAFVFVVLKPRY